MTEQITMENAQDWHVCGLVVQGNPQKIEAIQTALLAMPHTEIPVFDAKTGKLVVVMQSHDKQVLHQQMEATRDIDGVIDVSLVYHQQDEN
ncbi:chaperone NapD [Pasteurella oralis]|uniref:Chaperone NapD n=1 Tax=Pasteurella oralis TaxID=1071947 RepID=A0ABW4NQI8_9PAST|nr:chaperone NapD [Pasteurella oralis]